MVTLTLPLEVFYTKNKKFILNLNNYRNAHYRVLSSAKKTYSDNLVEEIEKWDVKPSYKNPVHLEYVYYAKSNRRVDVSNPCSIIDKFACDALVRVGILEDDSSKQVESVAYLFGGVDKEFPRCRLTIKEVLDDAS